MSTTQDTAYNTDTDFERTDLQTQISDVMDGDITGQAPRAVYEGLGKAFGLPEVVVGRSGALGIPTSGIKRKVADNPEWLEERYGTRHPFLSLGMTGREYDPESVSASTRTIRSIESARGAAIEPAHDDGNTRALVDEGVIGAAAPVEVDPVIVDVQRSAAPELEVVSQVAQPGFSYQYNVISGRDDPVGFLSEAEAAGDLEDQFSPQSFNLSDETINHTRQVGLVKVSDFSQRAMETLEYMDPRETTLGQAVVSHTLQKARAMFYGDPSVGAGDQSIEDGDAPRGLAKIADLAGNTTDKSTVSSGFMEDLMRELTDKIQNSGLTWDRARFFVSPWMYLALYEEATPVVRLDGYEADVEYGPQGIGINMDGTTVPITIAPNIRDYSGFAGVAANSDPGDVFLVDDLAIQIRQLAPMSTVTLGRTGLADRVALFEYWSFVDKSFDSTNSVSHTELLQSYDLPTTV